jgi:hypothetical protein
LGVVLPFRPRTAQLADRGGETISADIASEQAVMVAVSTGCDRRGVLDAAAPLLEQCRDRYGFTVMRDGLPRDPDQLADALLTLARGLALLQAEFGDRPFRTYGVYFGHKELAWFEDGYGGANALAVPVDVDASTLARFVKPRLQAARG